uniref:COG complex component COG2 C-terminal domain-containing protein n=1 Tax=Rhodosorus marinus TaxID=101924 RepID=A0A7S0BQM4_9RHOD|mmetsp:Transcript_4902/g.6835  ORF Transcript_4902/g.6835 Transcript_4902/m.6835 type:complete len:455 (+) Transcript_4902:3-1367(+)
MAEERMGNNAESVTTADILESAEILIGDFVRDKCNPVTSLCDSEERLRSFDFVNKAIWPEIESGIESNLNVFSPGIADVFHKSFMGATKIFSLLEGLCSTAEKLKALQGHKQTVSFWRRWSLPVYFQLRFQEVTNTFEDALKSTPSLMTSSTGSEGADTVEITSVRILSPDLYRLQATKALVSALRKCWDDDVFLPPLAHKFLKLSLQLLARYRTWTKKGLEESWGTAMLAKDVAVVFSDVEILTERLPAEVASVVRMGSNGKLPSDATTAIDNAFSDAIENLASLKPDLGERISSVISKGCIETLQTMRGILATYRMTNRPAPTQYSRFVPSVLKPLRQFLTDPDVAITESERNKILKQVVELTVTGYYELATDLLLNVRQTADTLRRLNIGAAGNNAEMDKISMQLYLDVRKFGSDINDLGLDSDQSEAYQKLWNCVKPEAVGVGVGEQGAN